MTRHQYIELLKNGYVTTILEMFETSDKVMINLVKLANYTLEEAEDAYVYYLMKDRKFKEMLEESALLEINTPFVMNEYAREAKNYIMKEVGINIVEPKNLREAFALADCVLHVASKNHLDVPMPSNFFFAKPVSKRIFTLRKKALEEWFEAAHGIYDCEE